MTALHTLGLTRLKLKGALPPSITRMPNLHTLHLQYNEGLTTIDMRMEKPKALETCSFQDCGWVCPVPQWASDRWPNGCSASCSDLPTAVNTTRVHE